MAGHRRGYIELSNLNTGTDKNISSSTCRSWILVAVIDPAYSSTVPMVTDALPNSLTSAGYYYIRHPVIRSVSP